MLLACEEELAKSAPKIIQFLPNPLLPKLNSPFHQIQYHIHYTFTDQYQFLVKLTAPNKQVSNAR